MRFPTATYRLQFEPRFGFQAAATLLPYLHSLGISDLYASPLSRAVKGSTHGYDVTEHTELNPELGKAGDFRALGEALRRRDMGIVLDVVPNHMSVADDSNGCWQDVLENGPSSRFATFFDIDWAPPKPDLANKVLLPILGEQYGRVLENGELQLHYARGSFWIRIHGRALPVAPRTWVRILEPALEGVRQSLPPEDQARIELESILTALRHLPPRTVTAPERLEERQREKEVIKRRLGSLVGSSPAIRRALHQAIAGLNGHPGEPRSFDALEDLLAAQAYRLSFWRVAGDEINYRRFFDVNELAAIRVEQPEVFERVHELPLRLHRQGVLTGMRIDHPDGLLDPQQYFLDLQEACSGARRQDRQDDAPGRLSCYVVVEKILGEEEKLDPKWAVHGTTGYDFMRDVNGIFVQRSNAQAMRRLYQRFSGQSEPHADTVYASKKLILDASMSGELLVLSRRLDRISEQHRWSRDFTLPSLSKALREVIACFPVYRTYIRQDTQEPSDETRRHIETAIRCAKRRNPVMSESIFDFIASVLLLQDPPELDAAQRAARREFVLRFQQLTSPVTAKGVEDTAFYRAVALASLNEVGGEPERFGTALEDFHRHNAERGAHWPHSMCSTSTHDCKRGEDVRARLNVLSEIPREWELALRRWQRLNRNRKIFQDGAPVPDANEEYFFYQTLIGVWPCAAGEVDLAPLVERLVAYALKAFREAKRHTSWINPNRPYEQAVEQFIRTVMEPGRFLDEVQAFVQRLGPAGALNALGQVLLKATVPGVPDLFQGCELWSLTLVDPDNRRPVDYERRVAMLAELQEREAHDQAALARELQASWADGRIKMYVTYRALQLRRRCRDLFAAGAYVPLEARGQARHHVCAFVRSHERAWVFVAVPRWTTGLRAEDAPGLHVHGWGDTMLLLPRSAPDTWTHVLTGATLRTHRDEWGTTFALGELFRDFPLVLLAGNEE